MQDLGDVLWRGLLRAPCAEQRADGVARWTEYLGDDADLLPLLGDDAPLVRHHGGRQFVVEVRAVALVALQDRHRHTGGWPYGPVTVRPAMPVDEALRRATDATAGLDAARRAQVEEAVGRDLASRVDPPTTDADACRAYLTLLALGLVEHEVQDVDPTTLLTAVQAAVHAGQAVTPRPAPHLRVDGPHGPVAWVLRTPGWVVDAGESPLAREVAALVARIRAVDRAGLPRVRTDGQGTPLVDADGAFTLDGTVPDDDVLGSLRALGAFVGRWYPCEVVGEDGGWSFAPGRVVLDVPVPASAPAPAPDLEARLRQAVDDEAYSLDLSGCGLETLPPSIGELPWLEWLDLSDNRLASLPDELCDLAELVDLDLTRNALTRLPERIGALTSLQVLRLHGNRLTELPPGLGALTSLRELHLGGNRIHRLPPELAALTGLEILTGLDDEPVLERAFLAENPGYWSATPQQVIAGVLAEQARRDRRGEPPQRTVP